MESNFVNIILSTFNNVQNLGVSPQLLRMVIIRSSNKQINLTIFIKMKLKFQSIQFKVQSSQFCRYLLMLF